LSRYDYPFHDHARIVTRCGRICLASRKINLSTSLAEQLVGIREVDDRVWQAPDDQIIKSR
jgi:hypothetical protein